MFEFSFLLNLFENVWENEYSFTLLILRLFSGLCISCSRLKLYLNKFWKMKALADFYYNKIAQHSVL